MLILVVLMHGNEMLCFSLTIFVVAIANTKIDMTLTEYIEKASNHLKAQTQGHNQLWRLGEAERWDADLSLGKIIWTLNDGRVVTADIQVVGTYNTKDETFLWGWDHPSVPDELSMDAKLLNRKVVCSETEAWEFSALANLLAEKQGVYRGPAGDTFVFFTFGEVEISKN